MARWPYRHHLSVKERLRRSLYEVLRDQLDMMLIKNALVDSYQNFKNAKVEYPFVPKRDLKPRARVTEPEYTLQNHFLVLFCEGTIPGKYRKYIRFFDSNKVTKESIEETSCVRLHQDYSKNLRYFDNPDFCQFVFDLIPVDYALLIQSDSSVKAKKRYILSHYHVRIDWPLDEATEDMALELRYIAKELYENGEKYAESLLHKLYERHGFYHTVGGRRTAWVVAAQFLRKMNFISTLYIASASARTLTKISERGVSRFVLMKVPMADIVKLAEENNIAPDKFMAKYTIDQDNESCVGILHVLYRNSPYANPPDTGTLRRLRPEYHWLSVSEQLLIPLPADQESQPLRYQTIYSPE
ncbi:MAG: hypothetical protein KJ814_01160 [Proteobacteria bacterium]|nr:hypothetical protein [Pseudomonadota bacterium]